MGSQLDPLIGKRVLTPINLAIEICFRQFLVVIWLYLRQTRTAGTLQEKNQWPNPDIKTLMQSCFPVFLFNHRCVIVETSQTMCMAITGQNGVKACQTTPKPRIDWNINNNFVDTLTTFLIVSTSQPYLARFSVLLRQTSAYFCVCTNLLESNSIGHLQDRDKKTWPSTSKTSGFWICRHGTDTSIIFLAKKRLTGTILSGPSQ